MERGLGWPESGTRSWSMLTICSMCATLWTRSDLHHHQDLATMQLLLLMMTGGGTMEGGGFGTREVGGVIMGVCFGDKKRYGLNIQGPDCQLPQISNHINTNYQTTLPNTLYVLSLQILNPNTYTLHVPSIQILNPNTYHHVSLNSSDQHPISLDLLPFAFWNQLKNNQLFTFVFDLRLQADISLCMMKHHDVECMKDRLLYISSGHTVMQEWCLQSFWLKNA